MAVAKLDIRDVVLRNYIPYAKMTIQERAIPDGRDGLKPVQRKTLYSMHDNSQYYESASGKIGRAYKSARIVGDVMGKYHPHGDSSIYGAIVNMTDDYNEMLAPYIHGDGTFGRVWSDTITPAAMRYTEAALNPIARELFEGLHENTVEFVPNFDDTETEPNLLPVKFPTILVNSTVGLAVGLSSNIPHYTLKAVCDATMAIISGKATKAEDLVDILGLPDFTTAGFIHGSKDTILKLIKTGKGTFTLSGMVAIGKDKIVVNEIPFNTTIDRIEEEIRNAVTSEKIKELKDVINLSGFDKKKKEAKMEMMIELKPGADSRKVLAKLNRYTSLRNKISYNTRVIFGDDNEEGKPIEIGVFDLLCKWIEWRLGVIQRQYKFKWEKEVVKEHKLKAWELINGHIEEVLLILARNSSAKAKEMLIQNYGLDDIQVDFLYDKKLSNITQDKLQKALVELEDCEALVSEYYTVVNNRKSRERLIKQQLIEIKEKYGSDRKSRVADEIVEAEEEEKLAEIIPDNNVVVVMTKKGLIKKYTNTVDSFNADRYIDEDDEIKWDMPCRNKDMLLVFTTSGYCYKVPVHVLDNSSRTKFKDHIWKIVEQKDDGEIIYVTTTRDYSEAFNIIYGNGKGMRIPLHIVSGNRGRYMNVFEPVTNGALVCNYTKFFIITRNNAAALTDITPITMFNRRSKFKIARLGNNDRVIGIQPFEKVPGNDTIDFSMYQKGYTVKIKHPLWETEEMRIEAARLEAERQARLNSEGNEEEADSESIESNEDIESSETDELETNED